MEQEKKKETSIGAIARRVVAIIAAIIVAVPAVTLSLQWGLLRYQTKDEYRLGGRWQMTDEFWKIELEHRKKGRVDEFDKFNFYRYISVKPPTAWQLATNYTTAGKVLAYDVMDTRSQGLDCDVRCDGEDFYCQGMGGDGYIAWLEDDLIAVENKYGEVRCYERQ